MEARGSIFLWSRIPKKSCRNRYGLTMGCVPAMIHEILSMPFPVFAIIFTGLLGCVWWVSRDDKGMS